MIPAILRLAAELLNKKRPVPAEQSPVVLRVADVELQPDDRLRVWLQLNEAMAGGQQWVLDLHLRPMVETTRNAGSP